MEIKTIPSRTGKDLACNYRPGTSPTLVFLPGYMSDMEGGKATAIDAFCSDHGHACLRLDYSGCGKSAGRFEDGTLDIWRDDVIDVINAVIPDDDVILVGSSMGGWLMLLVALAIPMRIQGLVGIAAAPDFTGWDFTDDQKAAFGRGETIEEPSDYDDAPYITTAAFWRSGEANRLLDRDIPLTCPVRLLHGQCDTAVPSAISLRLAAALGSDDVQTILIKDGDHRLSRPQDIDLLLSILANILKE